MPKPKKHAVVAVYTASNLAPADAPPGYLHLHALQRVGPLGPKTFASGVPSIAPPSAAYQFGTNAQLATETRSALVEHQSVARFGNLGLGSSARGAQMAGNFEGGGEAIIIGEHAHRVTRGIGDGESKVQGAAFPLSGSDGYWTAQVTDFSNASWHALEEGDRSVGSRDGLLTTLQGLRGLDPRVSFFAAFTAQLGPEMALRSNGGYASDPLHVRDLALFRGSAAAGGHLVSDSTAPGDLRSLAAGGVRPGDAPFRLRITGQVGIKPVRFLVSPERGLPFRAAQTTRRVAVIGGGMAGVTSALKIAEDPDAHVTVFEARPELLTGTSARTPGRMGLGLHYLGDPATAARYLRATVEFARQYPDSELGEGQHHLTHGRYFVVKDDSGAQAITPDDAILALNGLRAEYARLCREDPRNEVFGAPGDFYRILNEGEYGAVDPSAVSLGIESCERLLDFPRFRDRLAARVASTPNIEVRTDTPVESIARRTQDGFILNGEPFDQVVNCAWERAGEIAHQAGLPPGPVSTRRLKLLAEVSLPPELRDAPSAFFCLGPYAMFSNMGNGIGRLTFADVTNHSHSSALQLPDGMAAMLDAPNDSPERLALGRAIIEGVARYIPAMAHAAPVAVHAGIVITPGANVDIHDPRSDVHRRRESGVSQPRADWANNELMKLFYAPSNAKEVAAGLSGGHDVTLSALLPPSPPAAALRASVQRQAALGVMVPV